MTFRIPFLFVALLCVARIAQAGPVPEPQPAEHFSALWQKNPFTIASTEQVPQAGFAQNLAVVGIAKIGGESIVTVLNKQTQERFTMDSGGGPQGMKVVSVSMDADPLKASVTIRKGGETATVGFDRALLAMAQSPAPPAGATGTAGAPGTVDQNGALVAPRGFVILGGTNNGPPGAAKKQRRIPPVPIPITPTGAPHPPQ